MQKKRKQPQPKTRSTYAEQALFDPLACITKRGAGEFVLVASNCSEYLPPEVKKLMPEAELRIHAFDRHYAHAIKKRFLDAEIDSDGMVFCTPMGMPDEVEEGKGVYSLAF